ncbi:MAG: DUF3147 family protein [Candidatus Woykebacteria bacterium]
MDIFTAQLITAFLIGGVLVSSLSLLAEKAPSKTAGLILSLPSTSVVSFFFIGLVTSKGQIYEAALGAFPALGASLIFAVVYIYVANLFKQKNLSLTVSLIGGFVVWFFLAILIVSFEPLNLPYSLGIYTFLAVVSHYFLFIRTKDKTDGLVANVPLDANSLIVRSAFAGAVVATVVLMSKVAGPFWGGVFSVFPAAYASNLIAFHNKLGADSLFRFSKVLPIGSPSFVLYASAAAFTFPLIGLIWGTIVSYIVSAMFVYIVWKISFQNR